ncbi:helix-turn-helix domain-containing protein [Pelotomaculum isophthalicicum JI]|uniref:Helix-turn-helix domain-containing protein n=1 Tax=Pelotomaculum isophthalicicum JI TaxID=947010 RepID=A0A9X4JW58_9FIRM|nr:helix-turn-helix domain-containing protein [Pelotomaculum isophthalicicum]MDF9409551.1 helix-turn-helix domain-containing protein [Pelotomaculum isophthalicicum JI]
MRQTAQIERKFLPVEEVAVITGLSRSGAYKAIRDGYIDSVKIGRRVLVPVEALGKLGKKGE